MYQTGYKGTQPLSVNLPYNGGFCRWWYIPCESVEGWPIIDKATQKLDGPLLTSSPWYGPIKVPNIELGYSEELKRDGAGIFYNQKVTGLYPGNDSNSHINLENTPYGEYIVVGKMRAGGMYLVMGSEARGMEFTNVFTSKGGELAASNFGFAFQSLYKALILPSFNETNVISPPGYTPPPQTPTQPEGDMEEFFYDTEQQVVIDWNPSRQQRFGDMPVIQVFYTDPDAGVMMNPTPIIGLDALPPSMTQITVKINAPGPGLITISR